MLRVLSGARWHALEAVALGRSWDGRGRPERSAGGRRQEVEVARILVGPARAAPLGGQAFAVNIAALMTLGFGMYSSTARFPANLKRPPPVLYFCFSLILSS